MQKKYFVRKIIMCFWNDILFYLQKFKWSQTIRIHHNKYQGCGNTLIMQGDIVIFKWIGSVLIYEQNTSYSLFTLKFAKSLNIFKFKVEWSNKVLNEVVYY